jgi:mitochondrial fission protein ELM1
MEKSEMLGMLKVIVIVSDGIRGHMNQSHGVASWLAEFTGAEIIEVDIPDLKGLNKLNICRKERLLAEGDKKYARKWLQDAGGEYVVRAVGQYFASKNIHEGSEKILFISAGSNAAPFNLALAIIWNCACAVIMTPSVIGTAPFDFAIVPAHDNPPESANILATAGSPNNIRKEDIKKAAAELLSKTRPESNRIWSILIGGDDANYFINSNWIKYNIGHIINIAEQEDVDLYITTSRRTNQEAVKMLHSIADDSTSVRYLLVASEDPYNPIPAMLGFSEEIFCTEDSVNMVSEVITGGHRAVLMRVGHKKGIKKIFQDITASLISRGALPQETAWGIPKFDIVFDRFARHDALIDFSDWLRVRRDDISGGNLEDMSGMWRDFNEARRAALWILNSWNA